VKVDGCKFARRLIEVRDEVVEAFVRAVSERRRLHASPIETDLLLWYHLNRD